MKGLQRQITYRIDKPNISIGLYKAVHLVSYSRYSMHVLTVDNQCCRSEPFDLNTVEC